MYCKAGIGLFDKFPPVCYKQNLHSVLDELLYDHSGRGCLTTSRRHYEQWFFVSLIPRFKNHPVSQRSIFPGTLFHSVLPVDNVGGGCAYPARNMLFQMVVI